MVGLGQIDSSEYSGRMVYKVTNHAGDALSGADDKVGYNTYNTSKMRTADIRAAVVSCQLRGS